LTNYGNIAIITGMSLRDEIKLLTGNKRKFFLLRIADLDAKGAMKLTGIQHGTYNTWLQNEDFVALYRRREEFSADYKQEAIQMLRRDNQLEAVLLEGKIIAEMKRELDNKEYDLIRTNLAREVYSKLITDLDAVPKVLGISWEQRLQQIFIPGTTKPVELPEVIEGTVKELEESIPVDCLEEDGNTDSSEVR
jgi:hypothetical protein